MTRTKRRPAYPTIQAWMQATGTNQRQLAQEMGITDAHLSNILSRSRRCSLYLAYRLSEHCNVPLASIAEWPTKYGPSLL